MAMSLEQAQQLMLINTPICGVYNQPLEKCWHMVLAQNVKADSDFPPFDRSPLDGYAVRSEDVEQACADNPVVLRTIDYVPAGSAASQVVAPGTAVRIMTGAPIPLGADGVVRLEDTSNSMGDVSIFSGKGANSNICRQGEEIRQGEVVLAAGTILTAGGVSLLAMFGVTHPAVFKRPRVCVLATGSEVIGIDEPLSHSKIRNTNNYMLMAQIKEAGGEPILLGQADDNADKIIERLHTAPKCDFYITTGGASVGDFDLAEEVFDRLGVEPLFNRVAIKPGMPVWAGRWGNSWLIALSGNPAAASISYEMIIRPAVRKAAGFNSLWRTKTKGILAENVAKPSPTRRFVWGDCSLVDGKISVTPLRQQGNGMLRSLAAANAIIDIPSGSPALAAGSEVDVILISM